MLNLEIVNDDVSYLANGQYAQLNDATSNRGMYWKIRKNIDGTYSLYNKLSGYPLDVVCGVAENGKLCQQSVYNGTAAQKWTFEKVHHHNYTSKVSKEPTCTEEGVKTYTCECGDIYTEPIPAKGHNWNAAIYTWSADNKICTAIRVCANDSTHVETESVSTTYSVTKQPTNVEKGTGTYTATFKNTAFAEQTKNVDIPVTTHQYPVVTSEVQGRQFRLKWTAVKGAEKYGIAVYQSGGWRVKVQVKSNTTSYTSPKMKSGTYKMVVCAKINGNWDTSSLKSRAFNVKIA